MAPLAVVIPHTSQVTSEASRRPSLANSSVFSSRDSRSLIAKAPMTPPLSPGNSDLGGDAKTADEEVQNSDDSNPCLAGSDTAISPRSDTEMDVDNPAMLASPTRPLRLLEDEKVHLQKSGLKLWDFEVRGTLGWYL